MKDTDIVVVSTGCCTALAPRASLLAAEVQAGRALYSECSFCDTFNNPFTAAVLPRAILPTLPEELVERPYFTRREGLLLRFGSLALRDCLSEAVTGKLKKNLPALFLALPEHETEKPLKPGELLDDLAALNPDAFYRRDSQADWRGRAGGLLALGAAMDAIHSGKTTFALVGGVDTFHDPYILLILDMKKRVRVEDVIDYFVPGEGAGFLLLATRAAATAAGFVPLGTLATPASGIEKGPPPAPTEEEENAFPTPLGDGLSDAIDNLITSIEPAPPPIAEVYSTMNGESYWAREWGVARIRNSEFFSEKDQMHHPAEYYGDIGAASAPILISLALDGIRQGYSKAPVLVYASSDKGERAATLLTKATE